MQALVCPALEFAEFDLPSHHAFAETDGFDTATLRRIAHLYLGPTVDRRDPAVSPARIEAPTGLAPAVIVTAELDPLRDDGERYGGRLVEAGVPVTSFRHLGMVHYGVAWCRAAPEVAPGIDVVVDTVRRTLHRADGTT